MGVIWHESRLDAMPPMDPQKLPVSLRPFLALFEKWGDARTDATRYALVDRALNDPNEMAELKRWHELYSRVERSTFDDWLDGPLVDSHERAKVYFTEMLLYGELEIEKR